MKFRLPYTIVALALLLGVAPASAQTIVDKTDWAFAPSADHAATNLAGQPRVTGYEVEVYTAALPTVIVLPINVGKPALVNGQVPFSLPASIPKETVLLMKARALGQGGLSAVGPVSDPFGVSGPAVAPGAPGKPSPTP
jgi:hypothetical protein